jgi:hypothetical protein
VGNPTCWLGYGTTLMPQSSRRHVLVVAAVRCQTTDCPVTTGAKRMYRESVWKGKSMAYIESTGFQVEDSPFDAY